MALALGAAGLVCACGPTTGATHHHGALQSAAAASLGGDAVVDEGSRPSLPRAIDLQGHRGARGLFPENTLGAFLGALEVGVTTLELDLGITRDGVVVVHHDERLNPAMTRGPDGGWLEGEPPALMDLTWSELGRFDVGRLRPGSEYAKRFASQRGQDGVRIPRLVEVLRATEQRSKKTIRYNAETKLSPLDPELTVDPEHFAARVMAVVQEAGIQQRTTIQSFDWRTLRILHESAPELATSCLTSEGPEFDTVERGQPGASPWTAGLDVDAYGGSVPKLVAAAGCTTWSPDLDDLSPAALTQAHALGLTVAVWTVNEPNDIAKAIDWGVDAIISDYPDRVRNALAERGLPLPPRHGASETTAP